MSIINRLFDKLIDRRESVMFCRAYIIDFLGKRYMFHIWLRPRLEFGWHRKRDGIKGKIFWVEKY